MHASSCSPIQQYNTALFHHKHVCHIYNQVLPPSYSPGIITACTTCDQVERPLQKPTPPGPNNAENHKHLQPNTAAHNTTPHQYRLCVTTSGSSPPLPKSLFTTPDHNLPRPATGLQLIHSLKEHRKHTCTHSIHSTLPRPVTVLQHIHSPKEHRKHTRTQSIHSTLPRLRLYSSRQNPPAITAAKLSCHITAGHSSARPSLKPPALETLRSARHNAAAPAAALQALDSLNPQSKPPCCTETDMMRLQRQLHSNTR